MSNREGSNLLHVSPFNIEANRDNPRVLFDEGDMRYLEQSIKKNGILVPLIVYKKQNSNKWILLDGERRLRCARRLNLRSVPVNDIQPPTRVHNILLMFNIHNVRKDWEMVPTALKLESVIRLLPDKTTTNVELAKLTGMSTIRIAECKRVLTFDKKYIDMALDPDPEKRVRGDFFSQLGLVLEQLDKYPEIIKKFSSKNKIIDLMIKKYREGTIVNIVNEFRMLKKILISEKKGVKRNLIVENVQKYIESEPVRDKTNRIIKNAMTMDELFEETSYSAYKEKEIVKIADHLDELLKKFNVNEVKNKSEFTRTLAQLASKINRILEKF